MIDVLVVGAGPNGLMLAAELALAGIRPVVCDRLVEPTTENRANGLVGQVVRMLDRRGLHQRLTGDAAPPRPAPAFVFGALPLDLTGVTDNPLHGLPVPQRQIERVLAERAAELGVPVRRGCEVTGLRQRADAVEVEFADRTTLTCRYLVGADGGRSTVRKLAGIGFPGVTTDRSVSRTAQVRVPAAAIDPATGGLAAPGYGIVPPFRHTRTERGLVVWAPFPDRPPLLSTTEWPQRPEPDAPMTLAEMRASVARVLGAEVPLDPPAGAGPHVLRRVVGGNTRLAERYRDGRVLLLGDAAHVHSAIGGPGLNLGLQDAVNLGWKLAATLHGRAPDGLLDTYEAERRPAARRVTMSTQAQSALIAPGSEVTALRELVGELLARPGNAAHVAALMAGADVRYDPGPDGPPVGTWAPDLVVHGDDGPVRLAALTRSGRPLLLDGTGTLAAACAPWHDRVDVVDGRLTGTSSTALLLRPDCYLAWASAEAAPDRTGLRAALTRWFGRPRDLAAEPA
ncbi:FAD-dependent monooxygenase [Micromonospora robiginosa]|uniref:FAD-dependent monooxygenase n=1 Tax=Micromonospora robiginosa TaxID=2749844 RepID=A0A7L6B069_9ACTN|nr:FAD-dependent monooxygenase [Micromonospora ferruginea]QLQ35294.1 FAD-dependent monooxygenase [Micromonospora ferruginea]